MVVVLPWFCNRAREALVDDGALVRLYLQRLLTGGILLLLLHATDHVELLFEICPLLIDALVDQFLVLLNLIYSHMLIFQLLKCFRISGCRLLIANRIVAQEALLLVQAGLALRLPPAVRRQCPNMPHFG